VEKYYSFHNCCLEQDLILEASHYDVNTVYAAVNRIRCDDMHPHIFKTTDGGKSWKEITNGLPEDPINTIREDPKKKGLLFAGSERAVYVSFDDGEHWQSLRLNMPATSIRDLVIKDDDIVVATHGRSFWILDDITSLRQLNNQLKETAVILFQPQTAFRVRWNQNPDTPIPQEEPAGDNPPDGAIINYYLKNPANNLTLEILDTKGNIIRTYSNTDKPYTIPPNNVPPYWIRPQEIISGSAGSHRFVWDVHHTPLETPPSYPIAAIYRNTAPDPTSPWAMPGTYTIRLKVDGKNYTQPLLVRMDPRVKTNSADLQKQYDISMKSYSYRKQILKLIDSIHRFRTVIKSNLKINSSLTDALKETDKQLVALESGGSGSQEPGFQRLNAALALFNILENTDLPPRHN
jgi:hypothetical protein